MIGEINLDGIYLPPLLVWACLAAFPYFLLRAVFNALGAYRLVWHRALFDSALYLVLVALVDRAASLFLP